MTLVVLGTVGAIGVAGALLTRYKLMNSSYEKELAEEVDQSAGAAPHPAPSGVSDSADRFGKPTSM